MIQSAFNALIMVKGLVIDSHFFPIESLSSKTGNISISRKRSFLTANGSVQSGLAIPTMLQTLLRAVFIPSAVLNPPVTIRGIDNCDEIFSAYDKK